MYEIEQRLIPPGQGIRAPKKYMDLTPMGACWHWTANIRATAGVENHLSYWLRAQYGTQYIVDSTKIAQAVPDTEVQWHAGPGSAYTNYIKNKYPRGANLSLIGIELCVNSDGDWNETYKRAVWLGVQLCKKYNWDPYKNFERHFDCTGKDCPRMMTRFVAGGETAWKKFLDDVYEGLVEEAEEMAKFVLQSWMRNGGQKAVDELAKQGMLNTPEMWRTDEALSDVNRQYLFWMMIEKLSTRVKELERKVK
ncbi:N-acetylmuramoyl-L-alanine amidase [Natronincola peptidivorans]|uniref:N-acetylmuramoyl-L-alanine amidase n=1 Tax=Natronincola peptidivorans TaxID=426128 RepID=A0A1I0F9V3_9FIRM|nr:N-acetylmuramoyl-L-alanine amidase [Natronincola peptidivorans]SET54975.1 N-acetylmuramoyl-L-alanine amidase [Natronincola peptidivorans]